MRWGFFPKKASNCPLNLNTHLNNIQRNNRFFRWKFWQQPRLPHLPQCSWALFIHFHNPPGNSSKLLLKVVCSPGCWQNRVMQVWPMDQCHQNTQHPLSSRSRQRQKMMRMGKALLVCWAKAEASLWTRLGKSPRVFTQHTRVDYCISALPSAVLLSSPALLRLPGRTGGTTRGDGQGSSGDNQLSCSQVLGALRHTGDARSRRSLSVPFGHKGERQHQGRAPPPRRPRRPRPAAPCVATGHRAEEQRAAEDRGSGSLPGGPRLPCQLLIHRAATPTGGTPRVWRRWWNRAPHPPPAAVWRSWLAAVWAGEKPVCHTGLAQ